MSCESSWKLWNVSCSKWFLDNPQLFCFWSDKLEINISHKSQVYHVLKEKTYDSDKLIGPLSTPLHCCINYLFDCKHIFSVCIFLVGTLWDCHTNLLCDKGEDKGDEDQHDKENTPGWDRITMTRQGEHRWTELGYGKEDSPQVKRFVFHWQLRCASLETIAYRLTQLPW